MKLPPSSTFIMLLTGTKMDAVAAPWNWPGFSPGSSYGLALGQPGTADFLEDARSVYELLKKNQGPGGTFGHLAAAGSLAGALRGRIGSFADQVYPIYAFSQFAKVEGSRSNPSSSPWVVLR